MHIILGGTGRVGSAAAKALLEQGEAVTVVGRDQAKGDEWRARGARFVVADMRDAEALRAVLRTGRRAFLLNPPADVAGDTDRDERATAMAIVAALDGSGLEKVVAASTYGAQPGERIGDLSVLYEFERRLAAQPIPAAINRGAYYFSNWDMALQSARDEGVVRTMFPDEFVLPMVAPQDLGEAAARRLLEPADATGISYVEGPERYSSADVAAEFALALGRPVRVETTPRDRWEATFRELGFSEAAAHSYARMIGASLDGGLEMPDAPELGRVTLRDYIAALVE
jgi:uncharacterized protein YbjT (DUF2867 family)